MIPSERAPPHPKMASLFLLLLPSSVSHARLSSCFLLSGLKELKQLYSNVLVWLYSPLSLFRFFLSFIFFFFRGGNFRQARKKKKREKKNWLMDFQRCIHDMVMKFKFARHFLTRKRLIFFFFFRAALSCFSCIFFVPVATPNLLLNLRIGGRKEAKYGKML